MDDDQSEGNDATELAVFPTKSSSVCMTQFSKRNLLFAAGVFDVPDKKAEPAKPAS